MDEIMISTRVLHATLLLLASAPAALAMSNEPTSEDRLQAACYGDVQRLCKDAMPDEEKVTTCMKQHKSMVSAKCNEAYKASRS